MVAAGGTRTLAPPAAKVMDAPVPSGVALTSGAKVECTTVDPYAPLVVIVVPTCVTFPVRYGVKACGCPLAVGIATDLYEGVAAPLGGEGSSGAVRTTTPGPA
mmetsp:Transcript_99715/g.177526  ORF Transcript_99715/g.177526 Transcript_99715/m.177526 type:complete len:103 (-) Transcript_99715:2515-2823(-)